MIKLIILSSVDPEERLGNVNAWWTEIRETSRTIEMDEVGGKSQWQVTFIHSEAVKLCLITWSYCTYSRFSHSNLILLFFQYFLQRSPGHSWAKHHHSLTEEAVCPPASRRVAASSDMSAVAAGQRGLNTYKFLDTDRDSSSNV